MAKLQHNLNKRIHKSLYPYFLVFSHYKESNIVSSFLGAVRFSLEPISLSEPRTYMKLFHLLSSYPHKWKKIKYQHIYKDLPMNQLCTVMLEV